MSKEALDLLGAVSAAFPTEPSAGGESQDPPAGGESQDPPAGDEGQDPPAGDEGQDPPEGEEGQEPPAEGEEAEEEAEEGEEGEEAEEGEELDENGQPKKPFDPMKDPLPAGTLKRTQESFERLRNIVKETNTKLTETETKLTAVTQNYDQLLGAITGSGLNDQTFQTMLDYAAAFNSSNIEDRRAAYAFLIKEAQLLAAEIGEVAPGANPLAGHDDLIQEVKESKISPERAIEIAKKRNYDSANQKHQQRFGAVNEQRAHQEQAAKAARAELTKAGQELAAKDGAEEYKRKAQIVLANMKDEIMALPPARWASAFKKAYAMVPAAPPKPKPKAGPQPLRGNKAPPGGSSKQPKSMFDAVSQAVDSRRG